MKLYSILSNLILEVANRNEIERSIERHRTVRIYYEGDDTEVRGWRWIEPYVLGLSPANNQIVRAFQVEGVTDTDQPGWKTFRTDKITRWIDTPKIFFQPISTRDTSVPKYRENGDDGMITIYKQAKF